MPEPYIYLDNAATTAMDDRVLESMLPYMTTLYGNASSLHGMGRVARSAVEKARKQMAQLLGCSPAELFFTSGGTEADNTALYLSFRHKGIKRIITSPLEHHAVLHTAEALHREQGVELCYLAHDTAGRPNVDKLRHLLSDGTPTLVSHMHANNEIGTLVSLQEIGAICKEYGALFHSDTVQTMGYYPMNLKNTPVDYVVGSAHKFHGPKGVGVVYIKNAGGMKPFVHGGQQERNMRGGTENVAGIVGMATALELSLASAATTHTHMQRLKDLMMQRIREADSGIMFNGDITAEGSNPKVLSVLLPPGDYTEMLLFNLDIKGVCASGGSACTSGAQAASHVLTGLYGDREDIAAVRFSFSRNTTEEEVETAAGVFKELIIQK